MLQIKKNIDLHPHNTFGITATADTYVESDNVSELRDFMNTPAVTSDRLILGGGSNILFVSDRCEMVIRPFFRGIEIIEEGNDHMLAKAYAGEVWDDFVAWCVQHHFSGVENLSGIPGNVGACPIQNIGAYGTEAKEIIEEVETIEISTGKIVRFDNHQCQFGYRDSFFKQNKGKYLITSVLFRLSKVFIPNLKYAGLRTAFSNHNEITLENTRKTVIGIRDQKIPDPKELGNAGSFFKNPTISSETAEPLKQEYEIPLYPVSDEWYKTSAAWLIEQCGWKGKQKGNVGTYQLQPLILVNYGKATGMEILEFANEIIESVYQRFGIRLEPEVNIV
ncbi:MAG: UDP-N-acetylmuramate dehydrogenase [Bacteroidales bacterium]|jgi:UDP-N-acetylmuramate dehydrogenase|nr:UDP-N-acetylmuramate dehydrogenase [Bacteroidales bacterium]